MKYGPLSRSIAPALLCCAAHAASTSTFNGFPFPEGEIAFSGAAFNNIVISTTAPNFAVDHIQAITATNAPEPGTLGMMAAGVLLSGVGATRRRRR